MPKTLREIADSSSDAALAALLEHEFIDPDTPVCAADGADADQLLLESLRAILSAAAPVAEVAAEQPRAEPNERLASLQESVAALEGEVDSLRRRLSAREVLAANGIDAAALDPERLRLLLSQSDEPAMRSLVESWPAYLRRESRRGNVLPPRDRYPATLDEFVAAVK